MKKAMFAGFLSVYMSVSLSMVYAQSNPKISVEQAKAQVELLLSRAEKAAKEPAKLNDILNEFMQAPGKYYVYPENRSEISQRLIKLFYALDDSLISMANKEHISEIVGFSDNSAEAHKFFLDILSSDNEKYREMALWGIRPVGVHGDDLYDKVISLEKDGKISKKRALQCKARANPKRALEEMKTVLKNTQDRDELVFVAANLPENYRHDLDVMDIIVDRFQEYLDGKHPAWNSPERVLYWGYLWRYIKGRDGQHLKTALAILKAQGVCENADLPILQEKLKSSNSISREAVADFLGGAVSSGNLKREKVEPILMDAKSRESDTMVRKKIGAVLDVLEKTRKK